MTSSADKQLGYFFCKPSKKANETDEKPTIITADTLVGKVIFYLWNDVFKDYGFEDASLFTYQKEVEGKNMEKYIITLLMNYRMQVILVRLAQNIGDII